MNFILDEKEFDRIIQEREHFESPNCTYSKTQFVGLGKLVWITGAPGVGKSTVAQMMCRHHDYIYFEGDCYKNFVNPYVDPNVEDPSSQTRYSHQKKSFLLPIFFSKALFIKACTSPS